MYDSHVDFSIFVWFQRFAKHNVWFVCQMQPKMLTVFCVKMPVYLSRIHLKNVVAMNVPDGSVANGHCVQYHHVKVEIKPYNEEVFSVYIRMVRQANYAIQMNNRLHYKNVIMNVVCPIGASTNGQR